MPRSRTMLLVSLLVLPLSSRAGPPEPERKAPAAGSPEEVVQRVLLSPLASRERDRGRFPRAMPLPTARRLRILDTEPRTDGQGGRLLTFAIDTRHGFALAGDAGWNQAAVTGCAYPSTGEVFVHIGPEHRPAAFLLGKRVTPGAQHICRAATS